MLAIIYPPFFLLSFTQAFSDESALGKDKTVQYNYNSVCLFVQEEITDVSDEINGNKDLDRIEISSDSDKSVKHYRSTIDNRTVDYILSGTKVIVSLIYAERGNLPYNDVGKDNILNMFGVSDKIKDDFSLECDDFMLKIHFSDHDLVNFSISPLFVD